MLASGKSRLGDRAALLNHRGVYIGVVVLLLVGIGGAVLALRTRAGSGAAGRSIAFSGQAAFIDSPADGPLGHSDALVATASGLAAPSAGSQYDAWLVDAQTGHATALGTLAPHAGGFALTYSGDGRGGQPGTNLLGITLRPRLEITLDHGAVQRPSGNIMLAGALPPGAFQHVQHLLVSWSDTPGKIGFLVGLLNQSRLLDEQSLILQSIASSADAPAIQCLTQTIVDIIEGAHGANYKAIPGYCDVEDVAAIGDGYGILGSDGYLAGVTDHASLAAQSADATNSIHLHAGNVEIAATNMRDWVTTIDRDAVNLINNPNDTSKVDEIATLADRAYHGTDSDGDGQVDPVAGEAGAVVAYRQGQLLASFALARPG
jgi:hypothetical protein